MEVHITVCMALLVCVLFQPVHSCIEPSLHGLDLFLEIFLWRLNLFLDTLIILLLGAAHVIAVDESSAHVMCIDEWRPTTSILCPLSLPRKKAQAVSLSYAQSKAKKPSPENFIAIGGCFERYTRIGLRR